MKYLILKRLNFLTVNNYIETKLGLGKQCEHYYDHDETGNSSIEVSNANRKEKLHPTEKPLELFEYLIKTYSNEGDMVLDNTMGSGTTCLAAKELNRKFIGIEKDEAYFKIAEQRINALTLFS